MLENCDQLSPPSRFNRSFTAKIAGYHKAVKRAIKKEPIGLFCGLQLSDMPQICVICSPHSSATLVHGGKARAPLSPGSSKLKGGEFHVDVSTAWWSIREYIVRPMHRGKWASLHRHLVNSAQPDRGECLRIVHYSGQMPLS